MKKRQLRGVLCLAAIGMAFLLAANSTCAKRGVQEPNTAVDTSPVALSSARPMIIWWGSLYRSPEILRLVLSSGVFSHAVLVERSDFQRPNYLTQPNFKKAFEICRQNNVKVIWTRWLYSSQPVRAISTADLFTTEYYVERIRRIKAEARRMGADLVAFDAEPYSDSPAMQFKSRNLTASEARRLETAIKSAVKIAGPVDLVIPEGTPRYHPHLYEATRAIGRLVMSTQTYYDRKPLKGQRPYDIFGAAVSVSKKNARFPRLPLYRPREILERQDLWAHKKGLFIYPYDLKDAEVESVARDFSLIKTVRPADRRDNGS